MTNNYETLCSDSKKILQRQFSTEVDAEFILISLSEALTELLTYEGTKKIVITDQHRRAFLYVVAKRKILNELRRNKRVISLQKIRMNYELNENLTIDSSEEKVQVSLMVDYFLHQLPEKRREVWRKKFLEGYSITEISEQLSISINTVKDHLLKGKQSLRKQMGLKEIRKKES